MFSVENAAELSSAVVYSFATLRPPAHMAR